MVAPAEYAAGSGSGFGASAAVAVAEVAVLMRVVRRMLGWVLWHRLRRTIHAIHGSGEGLARLLSPFI